VRALTLKQKLNRTLPPGSLLQAKLVRRSLRRFIQMVKYNRLSLRGIPILFANSFPKSGTHLLTQVMQGFSQIGPAVNSGLPAIVTFEGNTSRLRPIDEILSDLRRLLPADIAYGHLHALPEVVDYLCQDGVVAYFILRDPRDVAISHVHYVTEMEPNHIHYQYFRDVLQNFDDRLQASILGRPEPELNFPDIRLRFEPYLGWLDRPEILVLRFEDFIVDQAKSIGMVLDHAINRGYQTRYRRDESIRILSDPINPRRSPTFRSGKSGNWQTQFTERHKRLFKEIGGDLLIRLGYERNHDW